MWLQLRASDRHACCTPTAIQLKAQKYFLPIHGDVEHISGPHDGLVANNIFKIGKLLIIRVIKINLEIKIWMREN